METLALSIVRLEFARRAEWRREDEERVLDHIKAEKKHEQEEREADEAALADYAFAVLASETDIANFTVKLDAYDAATIEALHENEAALVKTREELRLMLDKAYVMPDGRKVFKTEDGKRIFDEKGQEVKNFDPDQIEDWRPRWERYSAEAEKRDALLKERQQLNDYQAELDEARERTGEDGLTKDDLDDLERRLDGDMPEAVRRHLSGDPAPALEKPHRDEPQAAPFQPTAKLDMPML